MRIAVEPLGRFAATPTSLSTAFSPGLGKTSILITN